MLYSVNHIIDLDEDRVETLSAGLEKHFGAYSFICPYNGSILLWLHEENINKVLKALHDDCGLPNFTISQVGIAANVTGYLNTETWKSIQKKDAEWHPNGDESATAKKTREKKQKETTAKALDDVIPLDALLLPEETRGLLTRYLQGLDFTDDAAEAGFKLRATMQNVLISGPSGSGKTTLAKSLGTEIAKIISNGGEPGPVTVIKPADIIGKYCGHSLGNLKELFNKSVNGVVVFDEIDTYHQIASFGDEVINAINTHIGTEPNKPIIIGTTYESGKHTLFSTNEGLSSRFRTQISINGQNDAVLTNIFASVIESSGMPMEAGVTSEVQNLLAQIRKAKGKNFGNVREVENIIGAIRENMAARMYEQKKEEKRKKAFEFKVLRIDVPVKDSDSFALLARYVPKHSVPKIVDANANIIPFPAQLKPKAQ